MIPTRTPSQEYGVWPDRTGAIPRDTAGSAAENAKISVRQNPKRKKAVHRLALLGAGRVGRTLGYLLQRQGHTVTAVIARTPLHARQAVRFIGQGRPGTGPEVLEAVEWDLLLITTPDECIAPMARTLAGYPLPWPSKTVLHCSGYHSAAVLRPVAERGAAVGSLHPLQTFAEPGKAIHDVRGSYFAVEGDRRAVSIARRLVADLGGRALRIPSEGKPLYHCAAFLASGHMAALFSLSIALLERIGIPENKAKALLHPLMTRTLENLARLPIAQAVTGPISRGDNETVRAHLQRLAETDSETLAVYKLLGARMVDLVAGRQLTPKDARRLKKLIKSVEISKIPAGALE